MSPSESGSERAELAAARVRSARRRSEQLRERIERLSRGAVSTEQDVFAARAAAEEQRLEALRARERLAAAHALATRVLGRRVEQPRREPGAKDPADASAGETVALLRRQRRLLRSALLSVVSSSGGPAGGGADALRRKLWEAMFERCGQVTWQGWVPALCVVAADLLPGVRGVAVSGYDARHVPYLLGASDAWTRQAEEVERVVGEGPASDSYRSGLLVSVAGVDDQQARWPGYAAAAAGTGLDLVSALPVLLNGVPLASVTLFWRPGDESKRAAWHLPALLASVATEVLQLEVGAIEDGLAVEDAVSERTSIATGMLAEQLGIGVDEALDRMRAFAFGEAQSLSEVAEAIMSGTLRLP